MTIDRRALLTVTLAACGAAQAPPPTPPPAPPRPPAATAPRLMLGQRGGCGDTGGMQIEGQLGTIPLDNVRRVMREAQEGLRNCFTRRFEALPCLAGRVDLKLRVGIDGAVRWTVPMTSTMGDREVEQCMIEHARTLRFTAPCGGESEVTNAFEMDGGPDVRAATSWPPARVAAMVRQRRAALLACRGASRAEIVVSLYVSPEGTVAAAGASAPDEAAYAASECALREVRGWRLPSPGSWYARTSFNLP